MLFGRTVLIVEAQYLIALDLENTLSDFTPGKVVIAQSAAHARESDAWVNCDLAIVEVEQHLPEHIAFVGDLVRQGIPVIVLTADASLPENLTWFPGMPILTKPVPGDRVLAAISALPLTQKE